MSLEHTGQQERHGPILGNRNLVESSIPVLPVDCMEISARPIMLVSRSTAALRIVSRFLTTISNTAAKMALVGLTETLAREGAKYNIHANALAPSAASRMTETVWPPEMLSVIKPDWVVPLVGVLTHASCTETGSIFEAAAGHFSKIRWQRSPGVLLRPDETLTPGALLKKWSQVRHFEEQSGHFVSKVQGVQRVQQALSLPPNEQGEHIDFKGKVALVTGAGEGLGRAYAQLFGKLGAKVVVNDLRGAETVANGIKNAGGEAVACAISVEDGEA